MEKWTITGGHVQILKSYHTLEMYQMNYLKYSPYKTVTRHPLKEVVPISKKKMMIMRGAHPFEKLKLFSKGIGIPNLHDIPGHTI